MKYLVKADNNEKLEQQILLTVNILLSALAGPMAMHLVTKGVDWVLVSALGKWVKLAA